MRNVPSPRRRHLFGLLIAVVAIAPAHARLIAQTRQVSTETFVYDLKSPDPGRRQTAAHELGLAHYKAAIPQFIAMASDPAAPVRREVEMSLEQMDDSQTIPGFIAFAMDNEPDIRARAVASLVNIYVPHAIGVTSALSSLRERIVFGSDRDLDVIIERDVPVDPTVVASLRARFGDSERGIRRTAVRGLGILRAQVAIPDLLQLVREDRDDGLRFEGIRALRKIGDASTAAQLVPLLNINTPSVRNELITTLGKMRYRGAVPDLSRMVEQGKRGDESSVLALAALADVADPSSASLFERYRADESEEYRVFANEGIARLPGDSSTKTQISAARLVEKSARVRTAQAFALLRSGESEYLDELIRSLDHLMTRDLAREYLLETPDANRAALFAPRQASSAVREELADLYGRLGDPEALPRLQELAHDSNKNVARAADRATRRIAVVTSGQ